ncbi:MAG: hypothetical protein QNK04_03025 [Myxococcota bacterium]|nr:hypothetical protein [Myxococcota bacterium]
MRKLAIRGVAALVALLLLLVGGVALYSNEIVGTAIERGATYALGVDTRVGFVRLRLLPGDFTLRSLRIANPAGFDEPYFLDMSRAWIAVERESLRQPVVRIPSFELEGIDVALERRGQATNYGVITSNLKRFESGDPVDAPPEDAGSETRFIVDRLTIRDVDAHVEWNQLASNATGVGVHIPEITLTDIGAHNAQGVVMSELTGIVLKAILGAVARYGTNLPAAISGGLQAGLGGLTRVPGVVVSGAGRTTVDKVADAVGGDVGDAVRGVGGSAVKSVTDAVGSETGKALGGLFGGEER